MVSLALPTDWNSALRYARSGGKIGLVGMVVTTPVVEAVGDKTLARVGIACNALEVGGVVYGVRRRQYFEITQENEAGRFASRLNPGMLLHVRGVGSLERRAGKEASVLTIVAEIAVVVGRGDTANLEAVKLSGRSL